MARTREDWSMAEWRDYYARLAQKASNNYQQTGEGRYDREFYKYDTIVDAFNGYLEYKDERDNDRERRLHNIDAYVADRTHKDAYTKAEVMAMINAIRNM